MEFSELVEHLRDLRDQANAAGFPIFGALLDAVLRMLVERPAHYARRAAPLTERRSRRRRATDESLP
jgi:hypothetical protein